MHLELWLAAQRAKPVWQMESIQAKKNITCFFQHLIFRISYKLSTLGFWYNLVMAAICKDMNYVFNKIIMSLIKIQILHYIRMGWNILHFFAFIFLFLKP